MQGGSYDVIAFVVSERNDEIWIHFKQFLCIFAKLHM